MDCSFCGAYLAREESVFALCPACEARLVRVSPARPEYRWFVAAVRRALFGV